MAPQARALSGNGLAQRRLTAEHVIARALVDASTFAEAVPKILEAICEALGLGARRALAHRSRAPMSCAARRSGRLASAALSRVRRRQPGSPPSLAAWVCRAVCGPAASPSGSPTSCTTPIFRARTSPRAKACTRHSASRSCCAAKCSSVMEFFSREIRAPDEDLLSMLTSVGNQIGLFVDRRRAQEELDRFFTLSLDMLCIAGFDGYFKRVNPAWQRDSRLHRSGAAVAAVHGLRPSRRSRGHDCRSRRSRSSVDEQVISFENRYFHKDGTLRWLMWTSTPFREQQVMLRRRARHHRTQGGRRDAGELRARPRGRASASSRSRPRGSRSWSRSSRSRSGGPKRRRRRRARSSPT